MKRIALTQGKFALIDDEDFEKLNKYNWRVHHVRGYWYARRTIRPYPGERKSFGMHQQIMDSSNGMWVDHRDGNGLNNQKSNLRICTPSQNSCNRKVPLNSTSGFKGVCLQEKKYFVARIMINGKSVIIGSFKIAAAAAHAYDKMAKKLHGEFASLNFPAEA